MKKKEKLGRKLLSFLLTLALVLGLMPGMSMTAYATGEKAYAAYDVTTETNKTKSGDDLTALQVTFNERKWYIIEDNSSSATSGTVTLLSADTTFGTKKFADNDNDKYSTSQVKTYLDNMTEPDGEFADVADAIETVNLTTNAYGGNDVYETVNNVKLYLLSKEEAESLPVNVRKAEFGGGNSYDNVWWLRSPDSDDVGAMFVDGVDGSLCDYADGVDYVFGVRPALKLDLSKVVFDSTNNSFNLKPHEHDEMTFQAWNSSTSLPDSEGNYYLGCDVTLQGEYDSEYNEYGPVNWVAPSGTTNLCLDGHSIHIVGKWSSINVTSESTLNIYDDGETSSAIIQGDSDAVESMIYIRGGQLNLYSGTLSGALTVYNESGTFNMYGGNVQGSSSVYVENGVFRLEGGQIKSTVRGVGVGDSGSFTMSGGKITGSSSDQPAVGVSGTFTMSGGEICNNNCPSNEGGTVSVGGTFNMEGGSIYGNTAKRGGGIGVVGNGTFNLTGGSIYGNTAENGGGVYAYVYSDGYYKSHVNITGGSITGNNATSWGGGIYGAENVYLSGSPQIYDNYLNGQLSGSVYEKGDAGANNNLCITNSGDEDNIDYFNVNGELSSDSRVGINLPTEKLDAATFPLVISRGFGGRIEEEDGESFDEWYSNWDFSFFSFDRDGYTLTYKEVVYDRGQKISEVAVGLNEVYYTEDDPHETYDYNVISGGSGNQNWSSKKEDQVIFEDTTITGNIQIKGSTDVTRIIYGNYYEGADLTVNGSIYSDALTGGDGSGNLRVCGTLDEYCKLKVASQTTAAPAINVKNISVYGATLELAGPEGGSALRSDACISSPYTFIYESEDGINYTYHPYTSGSTTPIGNLKRYVKINNTEPEWVAEVTSGDDTSKYVDFNAAITAWSATSGSTLKLLKDITTSETITVTGGTAEAPMVLDLNGQGIMYTGNGKAPVITVDNGGVFNLNDSDTTKKHYITLTSGRGTAVSDANSDGAIKVTGGYITGGTGFNDGSTLRGGGVLVKNGTFTISGGTIVGNNAKDGGGVSVAYNSNFTMNGGSIYYNTASENAGGVFAYGVTGSNKASVIINEGNIIKNTAQYGGGVFIGSLGAFTMNGGKIEGNTASFAGGGVVQNDNKYEFAVNGGSITENKAMSLAGGIACTAPFNLSGDVTITGNKVGDEDGNVYLIEDGAITLTDALSDTASIGITMQTPSVFTSSTGDIKAKDYSSRFFSDNSEYIVKADGNELKLSTHEHSFTYSAEDGTITATCTDHNGCPLADNGYKATLTISADGGTYDGTTSYEATVTDENSIKGDAVVNYYKATDSDEKGDALSPLTTAPTKAGRYWAEITLGTGDNAATAHVVYTIEKAAETAPAADTNQLNINYPDETISAKPGYEVASDDNGAEITDFSSILDETTPTIYIRKTASDDNHTHSDWVPVTLPERPDAPTGLGSTNATDGASEDGTITGVNDTMEYSADGTNWTSVNGTTVTGLKAGTYKVRVKATEGAPCGNAAEVIVGSNYKALDDSVSVIIKKGDSEIGETVPVVDDVLTADCEASNIVYQWYCGGEPIDGATEGTYTLTKDDVGKAITVQAIQTKKADGTNYGENDRPEKMSESTEAVVKKDGPAAPVNAQVAEFVPDYSAETFTIGEGYEVSSSDSEDEIITGNSLTDVIDGTGKIYIRAKETDDTKAGAWLEVTLPARPVAPTELGSTNATDGASEDGTITGVNDTMEYSADGTNWISVNGTTITGLKAGTYKVRVKATEVDPCGNAAEVIVESNYKALDETVSVIINKGDFAIGGTVPVVDDVLIADCEASNIIYQWYRDGEPINGATEETYTLTKDDVGKAITVQAIQTKKADGTNYGENDRPKKMSEPTKAVVKKDGPAAPISVDITGFTPDYKNETFTIGEDYEVSSSNDEDGILTDKSLTEVLDGTGKIYIRAKETDDTKAGAWLEVTLPARPVAPTELGSTDATDGVSKDGTITGVNDTMEYSADGTNWTPVTGTTITDLKAGTYKVHVKATDSAPHGISADVTVGSREITLTDSQKPTAKNDLVYNGSEQSLLDEPTAALPEGATGLQYAIGTDASAAPTSGWGASIPAKTDAGTYYVWYKVVGDINDNDSKAVCITVVIKPQSLADASVTVDTKDKTVTVKNDRAIVPAEAYHVIYFTYKKIEGGESLKRVGTDFPEEYGEYIAAVVANENSGYTGENRSEPFAIGTTGSVSFNQDENSDETVQTAVKNAESSNLSDFAEELAEEGKFVKVELEITPVKAEEVDQTSVNGTKQIAEGLFVGFDADQVATEYFEIDIKKYVNNEDAGIISDTKNPLEITLTYDKTKMSDPVVVRTHNGETKVFEKLSARPAEKADYKDATYYVGDGMIYLYSQYFSDYAIIYSTVKTYNVVIVTGTSDRISKTVAEGSKVDLPTGLSKSGYTFSGWYSDEAYTKVWNANDPVTADTTIYAKWTKNTAPYVPSTPVETPTPTPTATPTPTETPTVTPAPVKDTITAEEAALGSIKLNAGFKVYPKKSDIVVKWGKVDNADRYVIYAAYCKKGRKCAKIATLDGDVNSYKFSELNGKPINTKKNIKLYVVAYRKVNGKYKKITSSITAHIVGSGSKKYSNVKGINVESTKITLSLDDNTTAPSSITLKPTAVIKDSSKKMLRHTAEFRYATSKSSVATVGKDGTITAKGIGTCYIYVYAQNGYAKRIKVTVK